MSTLGDSVALEMEEIMSSKAHNDLFYKKANTNCKCPKDCEECDCSVKNNDCVCDCLSKEASEKCKCPSDCECNKDGECSGDCNCACDESSCMDTVNARDIPYILNKLANDLDENGYEKTSIAVINILESIVSEGQFEGTTIDSLNEEEGVGELQSVLDEISSLLEESKDLEGEAKDTAQDEASNKLDLLAKLIDETKDEAEVTEPLTSEWDKELPDLDEDEFNLASSRLDNFIIRNSKFSDNELGFDLDLDDILASDDLNDSLLDEFEDESKDFDWQFNSINEVFRYLSEVLASSCSEMMGEVTRKNDQKNDKTDSKFNLKTDNEVFVSAYEFAGSVEMALKDNPEYFSDQENVFNTFEDFVTHMNKLIELGQSHKLMIPKKLLKSNKATAETFKYMRGEGNSELINTDLGNERFKDHAEYKTDDIYGNYFDEDEDY